MITPLAIKFSSSIGGKLIAKGLEGLYKIVTEPKNLDEKFHSTVLDTARELQIKYPDLLGNSIDYFFAEPDVFQELLKLLFKKSKINNLIIEENFDVNTLPKGFVLEFITALKVNLLKDKDFDTIFANNEIYIALIDLSENIERIKKSSSLAKQEIIRIRKLLEGKRAEPFFYNDFFEIYKQNALNILSEVNFFGLGLKPHIKKNRKNLQDIFVAPIFRKEVPKEKRTPEVIDNEEINFSKIQYNHLFSIEGKHLVILGDPGAGKSLIVKAAICSILNEQQAVFQNKDIFSQLPLRVELRNYLAFKKNVHGSLFKYLLNILETEYGVPNLSEQNLSEIFRNKSLVIFFDGLDEIFDISEKIHIKQDIENFVNLHKTIKAVVTSRIIGYEESTLNPEIFTKVIINNFEDSQIEQYVNKWYSQEEIEDDIRIKEITAFFDAKGSIDKELLTNPLLLSLIVILFRNNLKMPESKLEIYQSCTKTLVDKWDLTKGLQIDLDEVINKRKDSIFANLAFWQHERLSSPNAHITNELVISKITDVIHTKLQMTDDWIVANNLSQDFLTYAQKRSLYFDNNFTHKTFLEYYTAYWIYSNVEKKHKINERNELIIKYIGNSFWFIVLELLINMIDTDLSDNEVIDELLSYQLNFSKKTSLTFILYVLPTIKNISGDLVNIILSQALDICIDEIHLEHERKSECRQIFEKLEALLRIEHYKNIVVTLLNKKIISEADSAKVEKTIFLFMTLCKNFLNLEVLLNERGQEIYRFMAYEQDYLYRHYCMVNSGRHPVYVDEIIKYIDKFGVKGLTVESSIPYSNSNWISLWQCYIMNQMRVKHIDEFENNVVKLNEGGLTFYKIIAVNKAINIHFIDPSFSIVKCIEQLDKMSNFGAIRVLIFMLRDFYTHLEYINTGESRHQMESVISKSKYGDLLNTVFKMDLTQSIKFLKKNIAEDPTLYLIPRA